MIDQERHKELIEQNIGFCEQVIFQADRTNIGTHCHGKSINQFIARLKPLVEALKRKPADVVTPDELAVAYKDAHWIKYELWLLSQEK